MHVGTGLYGYGAYGYREDDNKLLLPLGAGTRKKDEFFYVQAGIEQAFTPLGKTTIFGEYYEGKYGVSVNTGAGSPTSSTLRTDANLGLGSIASTDISYFGIGLNQNIAAAAMDIYGSYRNYNFDVKDVTGRKAQVEDLQTFVMGARIQF